ncbi:MAG: class I SAM-dependent methyltransferase [Candidatus Absconditicoccaceae bacterium]
MIQDLLKDLRIRCKKIDIPIISEETQDYLEGILRKHKPKICLEIGSAVAYSTIYIANIVKERDGIVYSSEISYTAYTAGINNIKQSGLTNIVLYPFDVNKVDLRKLISKEIDFAFIDGQKNQYASYLMKIQNILRSNGIIVLDDVIKYHNKLSLLYGYLQKKQIDYKIVKTEPGDGIMIIKD